MTYRAEFRETPHGFVTNIENGGTRATAVQNPDFPELAAVAAALGDFAAAATEAHKRFQPEVAQDEILRGPAHPLLRAQARAMNMGSARRREWMQAEAKARELPATVDMSQESERRARIARMDRSDQYQAAKSADLADLAALVVRGNIADIAAEAFELAQERYLALAHVERAALASEYARRPTLDMLTPTGPDMAAAEAAAAIQVAALHERGADVERVERGLQESLALIAVALGMTHDEALEAVLASS